MRLVSYSYFNEEEKLLTKTVNKDLTYLSETKDIIKYSVTVDGAMFLVIFNKKTKGYAKGVQSNGKRIADLEIDYN